MSFSPTQLSRGEAYTHVIRIFCKNLSIFSGSDRSAAESFFKSVQGVDLLTPFTVLSTTSSTQQFITKELSWRVNVISRDCITVRVVDCPGAVPVDTLFRVRVRVSNESPRRKRIDVICGSCGESPADLLAEFSLPRYVSPFLLC